jgi:hypothetical protein
MVIHVHNVIRRVLSVNHKINARNAIIYIIWMNNHLHVPCVTWVINVYPAI